MFNKKIFLLQILVVCFLSVIIPVIIVNMLLKEVKTDIASIKQDIQLLSQNNAMNDTVINDTIIDNTEKEVPVEVNDGWTKEADLDNQEIKNSENKKAESIVKSIMQQYEEVQKELDTLREGFNAYENEWDIPEDMLQKESALEKKLDELFDSL